VELTAGMAFSVPRGMLHRPVALAPTQVLMIEETGVAVTGDLPAADKPGTRPGANIRLTARRTRT
jgi:hypothetical protein